MILDIIIVVILVLSAVYGFHKGFVHTLIHTTGWLVAVVGAFFLTPLVSPFVKSHTGLYSWLEDGFTYRFESLPGIESSQNSLPHALSELLSSIGDEVTQAMATIFSDMVFALGVFVGIFLLIKIILWILLHVLSKQYNRHTGGVDGFFGIIIGLVRGIIFVYLLLALLVPAINLMAADFTDGVMASLNSSLIAKPLYDNNYLLLLLQGLFT